MGTAILLTSWPPSQTFNAAGAIFLNCIHDLLILVNVRPLPFVKPSNLRSCFWAILMPELWHEIVHCDLFKPPALNRSTSYQVWHTKGPDHRQAHRTTSVLVTFVAEQWLQLWWSSGVFTIQIVPLPYDLLLCACVCVWVCVSVCVCVYVCVCVRVCVFVWSRLI